MLLDTPCDADSLEVLAMLAAMHTYLNILQDDMVWTSRRNDYSEQDVTIMMGKEGKMLCEWLQPTTLHWETSEVDTSMEVSDKSMHNDIPESVMLVVKALGRQPRV